MFTIVVGTYEKSLIGYEVDPSQTPVQMTKVFAFPTGHLQCIKTTSIDSSGRWCTTGSLDETIKIYDLAQKKEVASIFEHDDAITCSQFYSDTHFFSGTEEGTISIYKLPTWDSLKSLKGHRLGVNSLSIHPSGKLALSCSRDRTLRLWNLVNGRAAFDQNLTYEAEIVAWSPSGDTYAVTSFDVVRIFSPEKGKIQEWNFPHFKHLLCLVYLTETLVATGGEDHLITIWDINTGKPIKTLKGFLNRVKALAVFPKKDQPGQEYPYLVSISSDGSIKVWDLDQSSEDPVASSFETARLVCLAVGPVCEQDSVVEVTSKRKASASNPKEPKQKKHKPEPEPEQAPKRKTSKPSKEQVTPKETKKNKPNPQKKSPVQKK